MILVFDLDDTLYDEQLFFRGGLTATARWLAAERGLDSEALFSLFLVAGAERRERVFDRALAPLGLAQRGVVRACIQRYRFHEPRLKLFPDAARCLRRLAERCRYVVTDGHKLVQGRKITALGLEGRFRRCFVTHRHGRRHAKPSPYCFLRIAELEGLTPKEIVYVGDNPHKDFVGIKPLGFKTVRVLRGMHAKTKLDAAHEAHRTVSTLDALDEVLLRELREEEPCVI